MAAIAAVLCCAPAARAGMYTLDFAALAADSGRVVTAHFVEGGWLIYATQMRVIGPGDPQYSGSVGLATTGLDSLVAVGWAGGDGPYFTLTSASADFRPAAGDGVGWEAILDSDQWGPIWDWTGTAPGTFTHSLLPNPYSTDRLTLKAYVGNTDQVVGLTLDAETPLPAVPEPSSLVLGGLALAIVTARCGRSSRRRSASRLA